MVFQGSKAYRHEFEEENEMVAEVTEIMLKAG